MTWNSPASTPNLLTNTKLVSGHPDVMQLQDDLDKSLDEIYCYNTNVDTRPGTANQHRSTGTLLLSNLTFLIHLAKRNNRLKATIPNKTRNDDPSIPALRKTISGKSLGSAYLLEEMCGLAQIDDNIREDLEIGSDSLYQQHNNSGRETQLRPQSTNMTSYDFKQKEEFQKFKTMQNEKIIELNEGPLDREDSVGSMKTMKIQNINKVHIDLP